MLGGKCQVAKVYSVGCPPKAKRTKKTSDNTSTMPHKSIESTEPFDTAKKSVPILPLLFPSLFSIGTAFSKISLYNNYKFINDSSAV